MADRHKEELGTLSLCRQLASLVEIPRPRLEAWLRYLVVGMFQVGGVTQEEVLTENRSLLQSLTGHIVRPGSGVVEVRRTHLLRTGVTFSLLLAT